MGRPDDDELVTAHLAEVGHALAEIADTTAADDAAAAVARDEILGARREIQLSTAICLLAGRFGIVPVDTSGDLLQLTEGHLATNDLLDALRRRKLPWTSPTASLAGRLVADRPFDERRATMAIKALEAVIAGGEYGGEVYDAIIGLRRHLDATPVHRWGVTTLRLRLRSALAAMSPAGVPDLGVISDADDWGPEAREVTTALDPDATSKLMTLVGDLTGRTPSQSWRRRAQELVDRHPAALDVAERWLAQFLAARVVEPDEHAQVAGPGPMLLAAGNERAVRTAVELVSCSIGNARLLGEVVLRGATTRPAPTATAALALSVSTAAIDALARNGDRTELARLIERLERVDLIKRIGHADPGLGHRSSERAAAVRVAKRRT